MNVDLAAGYAKLSGLKLDTLGTSVTGDIDAKNINAKDSSVAGKLNITSPDVSALLKAYGQAELPVGVSNLNATANIAGSTFIPMGELQARLAELEPHKQDHIVVHCHHGGRSLRVTHFLRQQGFTQVQNMSGGIDAWSVQVDASVPRY